MRTDGGLASTRARIVAYARAWVGTPFVHQARVMGAGVDCAQLVRAVGEACGVLTVPPGLEPALRSYGRAPHPDRMGALLLALGVPITAGEALAGDVAWLAWRADLPMHLAILASAGGRATLIHALADAGSVVEHGFVDPWPGRVEGWWRYPGLVE